MAECNKNYRKQHQMWVFRVAHETSEVFLFVFLGSSQTRYFGYSCFLGGGVCVMCFCFFS